MNVMMIPMMIPMTIDNTIRIDCNNNDNDKRSEYEAGVCDSRKRKQSKTMMIPYYEYCVSRIQ